MKKVLAAAVIVVSMLYAQIIEAPKVVPVAEEGHHHLVLENEYVKVFQVEVPAHSETLYHQHDRDYIFVTLGDSVVENVRLNEKPVKLELKDGEARFIKGGFAHKAVNLSDKPFRNVTVEVKNPVLKQYDCDKDKTVECFREWTRDWDEVPPYQRTFKETVIFAAPGMRMEAIRISPNKHFAAARKTGKSLFIVVHPAQERTVFEKSQHEGGSTDSVATEAGHLYWLENEKKIYWLTAGNAEVLVIEVDFDIK